MPVQQDAHDLQGAAVARHRLKQLSWQVPLNPAHTVATADEEQCLVVPVKIVCHAKTARGECGQSLYDQEGDMARR